MSNLIAFAVVIAVVAFIAYKNKDKLSKFKDRVENFRDAFEDKPAPTPTEKRPETPVVPVFPPVNTQVAISGQKPAVEPVRTPEAIPTETKPQIKEPAVVEQVNSWPVGLPVVFSADGTGHQYPMYYDVALPAHSNLVVDEWFKGTFQILMTANPQKLNPNATWTVTIRDLHKEGAPIVGSGSAQSNGNFTMNIKPLANKPTGRVSPQDIYLPAGSYSLDFTSSAAGSNVLVTIAEFSV